MLEDPGSDPARNRPVPAIRRDLRYAVSFANLRFITRGLALARRFIFIQITVGLGDCFHAQPAYAFLGGRDVQILQQHNARKLCHVTRKRAEIMVAAGHLYRDRQFGIKLGQALLASRPKQLELQAAPQPSLVDIGQQGIHFALVGQLFKQSPERLLDILQLLLISFQIDGKLLLLDERIFQFSFLLLRSFELRELVAKEEKVTESQEYQDNDRDRTCLDPGGPTSGVTKIELTKFGERHAFLSLGLPSSGLARLILILRLNSLARTLFTVADLISTSSGDSSQGEAARLRINVEMRAFDCV